MRTRQSVTKARIVRSRRGAALVEVTLTLSMLLTLTFGSVEFAYCFYVKQILAGAATQGAWTAGLATSTNSDVTTAVAGQMSVAGLQNSGYTVTTTPTDISAAAAGSTVTVQVSCTWSVAGKGFRPMTFISGAKVISSSATMRKSAG